MIVWFRRDLRLSDHPVLAGAVRDARERGERVAAAFVLDPVLLAGAGPNRLAHLLACLRSLRADGLPLHVLHGRPSEALPALAARTGSREVRASADHAPYGRRRDAAVGASLAAHGLRLVTADGPYAVAPGTVRTLAGGPYRVFTPFHRAWLPFARDLAPSARVDPAGVEWFAGRAGDLGEIPPDPPGTAPRLPQAGETAALERWERFRAHHLDDYAVDRNVPGADATSRLSVDLKFGVVHPRQLLPALRDAVPASGGWVFRSELAWREFYADVLWHRPETATTAVDPSLESIETDTGPRADASFARWCEGTTGYPYIDAGMRQLRSEGWMHNRVRMAVASFLVKDLHLDWRRGAAWFMEHLVDGDLASNQHGWQWAAGTGTDAAPYVRIFNPVTQGRRFDPDGTYVRRHVAELAHVDGDLHDRPSGYVAPIVDHAEERAEALRRFAATRATPAPPAQPRPSDARRATRPGRGASAPGRYDGGPGTLPFERNPTTQR